MLLDLDMPRRANEVPKPVARTGLNPQAGIRAWRRFQGLNSYDEPVRSNRSERSILASKTMRPKQGAQLGRRI